jgi:hypothetical protein
MVFASYLYSFHGITLNYDVRVTISYLHLLWYTISGSFKIHKSLALCIKRGPRKCLHFKGTEESALVGTKRCFDSFCYRRPVSIN